MNTKNDKLSKYANQGRLIPQDLYVKLKRKRKCKQCGKIQKKPLEIHHIVPIAHGGQNKENNLKAVCKQCHKKLDKQQEEKYNEIRMHTMQKNIQTK